VLRLSGGLVSAFTNPRLCSGTATPCGVRASDKSGSDPLPAPKLWKKLQGRHRSRIAASSCRFSAIRRCRHSSVRTPNRRALLQTGANSIEHPRPQLASAWQRVCPSILLHLPQLKYLDVVRPPVKLRPASTTKIGAGSVCEDTSSSLGRAVSTSSQLSLDIRSLRRCRRPPYRPLPLSLRKYFRNLRPAVPLPDLSSHSAHMGLARPAPRPIVST